MEKKRVMFICIHNSVRSQMGEVFLRSLAGVSPIRDAIGAKVREWLKTV